MIDFDKLTENYFKKELRVKTIGKYYPSEIGYCLRKSWYSFINPKETDIDLTKVFEVGNMLHDYVCKVFASEKNPEVELIETESPFTIEVDDFIISGRIDNLVLLKGENKKVIVEVKSTKLLSMMKEPQESHVMQLQLYLHTKNIQDGVLLYVEKNTLKSKTFTCRYDKAAYEQIINRFKQLHKHLKESSIPLPEARLQESKKWLCRYCNYRTECFEETAE